MQSAIARFAIPLLLLGLTACSGDADAPATSIVTTPTAPPVIAPPVAPPTARAARVEIVQTGLLFTARGQTRQLRARVFDAKGAPVDAAVRWSSSDPSNISVASDGSAVAERATGSTQIVASVDGVSSAPLLAVVTRVAAGTVLVGDEQIVRGAVESHPQAAPSLDNTYTVVVQGIAAPAAGTLVAGTGSEPVAGRVVSTREVAGGLELTLKLAPLPELFPGLSIDQTFDLSRAELTIQPDIAAMYTVTREGNSFSFTPRAGAIASAKSQAKAGTAVGGFAFDRGCEFSATGGGQGDGASPPIVFEPFPEMVFTLSPALDVLYTESRGLERFVVTAEPRFVINAGFKATAAFELKMECVAELMRFRIPVGGALSFFISGIVPVGLGLDLGGEVTLAQVKVGFTSTTQASAEAGLVCEGPCRFIGNLSDFVTRNTPTVELPGTEDFRIAPELVAYGFIELAVGNPLFASLTFEALEIKGGMKFDGKFAPPSVQIAATDFKAQYQLSLQATAGLGDDIEAALNILGVVEVGNDVFQANKVLAASPAGTLTADKGRFAAGDNVQFDLVLDTGSPAQAGPPAVDEKPDTTKFLGFHNVNSVVLIRSNANGQREVARVAAPVGQSRFSFNFAAPDAGEAKEFTAFALSGLMPVDFLSLELATATGDTNTPPVAVDDRSTVPQNSSGNTIAVLANDRDADGDALTVSTVTQPARGTVTIGSGGQAVSYRPAAGFSGSESFRYTVIDGRGGSAEGLVVIEVRALPALVRLDNADVGSRADATSCPKVRNGVCARPAPLISEQRFYNESTGVPASDRTAAEASDEFNGARVKVNTRGDFSVGGSEAARQIDLGCESVGEGNGNNGDSNHAYGGSSASRSSIGFTVQGEGSIRYEISVVTAAGGPPVPEDQIATASAFAGLRDRFEVRHNSRDGVTTVGETSGFLSAGSYQVEVSCIVNMPARGGSLNSSGTVRLTLSP